MFTSKDAAEDADRPVLAPHFLTQSFGPGQQEVLTAALIAKVNVQGHKLRMELVGRLDLGAAGTRFYPREYVDTYSHAVGYAWGNMFLDCLGSDADNVLCQASTEQGRYIGRDSGFHGLAMFSCDGPGNYPTQASGKACFSKDMETQDKDGCGFVASAGSCEGACFAGFCGTDLPPVKGHGSTNILYVYMNDYDVANDSHRKAIVWGVGIGVFLLAGALAMLITALQMRRKREVAKVNAVAVTKQIDDNLSDGTCSIDDF